MTNEEFQNLVLAELKALKEDVSSLKEQTDENTQIIKAIRHNQELTNAKLEGLELTTAKAESVEELQKDMNSMRVDNQRIDGKLDLLNNRLFNQEADIQQLKRIK